MKSRQSLGNLVTAVIAKIINHLEVRWEQVYRDAVT